MAYLCWLRRYSRTVGGFVCQSGSAVYEESAVPAVPCNKVTKFTNLHRQKCSLACNNSCSLVLLCSVIKVLLLDTLFHLHLWLGPESLYLSLVQCTQPGPTLLSQQLEEEGLWPGAIATDRAAHSPKYYSYTQTDRLLNITFKSRATNMRLKRAGEVFPSSL